VRADGRCFCFFVVQREPSFASKKESFFLRAMGPCTGNSPDVWDCSVTWMLSMATARTPNVKQVTYRIQTPAARAETAALSPGPLDSRCRRGRVGCPPVSPPAAVLLGGPHWHLSPAFRARISLMRSANRISKGRPAASYRSSGTVRVHGSRQPLPMACSILRRSDSSCGVDENIKGLAPWLGAPPFPARPGGCSPRH